MPVLHSNRFLPILSSIGVRIFTQVQQSDRKIHQISFSREMSE
ncbi:hypothetical protein M595_2270 [Lyngbya aestuarii BL J]|uniref:Uncharacterized protein n=1 Tax=Lyngbya aestuarii BL J TaxID=1348334 RepID=U7QIF8_9CYAN|nr:hypothetical protein M595_2270 [Lyngbya aestuarii BL J]